MLTVILGAPGSGKTTVVPVLRRFLRDHAVVDWDDFMPAVQRLTGRDVRTTPELWLPYSELLRTVITSLGNIPTVMLGVCTPSELSDWPLARWILLDCDDETRCRRLAARQSMDDGVAMTDAWEYRALALTTVDSTHQTVHETALELTRHIVRHDQE